MELYPYIASYSTQPSMAIRKVLDQRALEMIASVAESPQNPAELDAGICAELIEVHVLCERDGLVRLATAVFLENDLEPVNLAALKFRLITKH